jgi:hypothetical protein
VRLVVCLLLLCDVRLWDVRLWDVRKPVSARVTHKSPNKPAIPGGPHAEINFLGMLSDELNSRVVTFCAAESLIAL